MFQLIFNNLLLGMKKFLLLFVMLSGMMMQQSVFAAATVSVADGVVTITAVKAGDLMAYLQSASDADKSAIRNATTIVFKGKFNGQDIDALNGADCCTQSVVDMSEARFVKSSSSGGGSSYLLYHNNTPSTGQEGQHCIVGATKYASAQSNSYSLVEISENEGNGWQVMNVLPEERNTITLYSSGACYQLPTSLNYYKLIVEKDQYNNETSRTWQEITSPTAEEVASAIAAEGSKTVANLEELKSNYQGNDIIKIRSTDCTYQYFKSVSPLYWTEDNSNYDDGATTDTWYSRIEDAPDPTDNGQTVYADGTEYVYTNGQWELASEVSSGGGDEEYDYTQMKFDYWKNSVEEITTSKYAEGRLADQLCTDCSNLKTLTLSAGDFALAGTVLGNNINSLETVNIKKDVTSLSANMFNGAGTSNDVQHFETLTFEDGCQIKTLPTGVFKNTGIKNLTIPSSVEEIQGEAFHSCYNLETVTFVNTNPNPLIIKTRAFQNSQNIKDVYVEVKFSDRHMICEYNAFDFKSMEGQTDENAQMTTLHFPEDDNSFNYYAGEWKKGMAIKQENLNAFKDGLDVTYNGQEYINAPTQDDSQLTGGYAQVDNSSDGYYHPSDNSKKYAPANGWQQFAKTDSEREIFVKGNIYMTYSTDKAYSLPTGIVAFRVTDYKEATVVNGKTTLGKLVLKMINQVPTETGMLLISTDQYVVKNENVMSVFFFGDPDGTPTQYHYTQGHAGDATSNYLAPAVHGIEVGPVSKGQPNAVTGAIDVNGSPFTHRNFAMNKNTHQFVRVKHIIMPDNRAFLSLPKEMFTNNNESATEGPNPWNTKAGDAFETYETTQYDSQGANTMMFFEYDVEKYGMIWPLAQKEDVTDGIDLVVSNSNAERVQEGIFTLQGVKVAQPTEKGIYIVNGKKVIIK